MKSTLQWPIKLIGALLLLLFSGSPCNASNSITPSNYCGIYSVYGASVMLGKSIPFDSLLNPKYLSCPRGSSITELERAITDTGLHSLTLSGIGASTLSHLDAPVILYIRASLASRNYDHYTLYLGQSGGKYKCIDSEGVSLWSDAELLSRWSGVGIIVTASPITEFSILWREWLRTTAVYFTCIFVPIAIRSNFRNFASGLLQPLQVFFSAPVFVIAVILSSILYHRISTAGLMSPGNVVADVASAYPSQFIGKRSDDDAFAAWQNRTTIFIDARSSESYASGHIKGSINIDVHTPVVLRRAVLQNISHQQSLTVYCQNDQCPYATVLASWLIADGYRDVTIYRDGWDKWRNNPIQRGDQ